MSKLLSRGEVLRRVAAACLGGGSLFSVAVSGVTAKTPVMRLPDGEIVPFTPVSAHLGSNAVRAGAIARRMVGEFGIDILFVAIVVNAGAFSGHFLLGLSHQDSPSPHHACRVSLWCAQCQLVTLRYWSSFAIDFCWDRCDVMVDGVALHLTA